MATVVDLARIGDPVDQKLNDPNRKISGSPIALALTPVYAGEIVMNTLTGELWFGKGITSSDWTPLIIGG